MNYMISVIVPVYNVSKYLRHCVDSILGQSYSELEIILVDDGSTDGSSQICDEYIEKDTRITVIHKENGGLSSARNKGLEIASGDYVSFIDSDDWLEKDFYSKMVVGMQEGADVVNGDYSIYYNNRAYPKYDNLKMGFYNEEDIVNSYLKPLINSGSHMQVWNNLYSLKFIRANNYTFVSEREVYAEDMVFNAMVYSTCSKVYKVCNPSYLHLIVKGSLSQSYRRGLYKMGVKRIGILSDFIRNRFDNQFDSVFGQKMSNLIASCLYKESLCPYGEAVKNVKAICDSKEAKDIFTDSNKKATGRYAFFFQLGKRGCYSLVVLCSKLLSLTEPLYRFFSIRMK